MTEQQDWNAKAAAAFRSTGRDERFGEDFVIVHSVGAKSGEKRVNPLVGFAQPDGTWHIAATWGGNDRNPPWYYNLKAHPDTEVEALVDGTVQTVPVHVTELTGAARDEAYRQFSSTYSNFGDYERATERVLPVLVLTRR